MTSRGATLGMGATTTGRRKRRETLGKRVNEDEDNDDDN